MKNVLQFSNSNDISSGALFVRKCIIILTWLIYPCRHTVPHFKCTIPSLHIHALFWVFLLTFSRQFSHFRQCTTFPISWLLSLEFFTSFIASHVSSGIIIYHKIEKNASSTSSLVVTILAKYKKPVLWFAKYQCLVLMLCVWANWLSCNLVYTMLNK